MLYLDKGSGLSFLNDLAAKACIKHEWIVVRDEDTDPRYGTPPYSRDIKSHLENGVINLDKPPGPTSHEVVAWIKRMFGISKAGHGGTLDPKVTGVLPVALGNATKVIGSVVHTLKEYVMVMQFHSEVPEERVREALKLFIGQIYQRPPLRSSVKRSIRVKTIYSIELLEHTGRYSLVKVTCDPGTYMRKLAHDIGLILGVGAHMRELRRTRTGPFKEDETLVKMQDVSEALYLWRALNDERLLRRVVQPVEVATAHLPKIVIRDTAVGSIAHGASLAAPGLAMLTKDVTKGSTVALFTLKGELVALGQALYNAEEIATLNKGIVVKTKRVYMSPDTYPRVWKSSKQQ